MDWKQAIAALGDTRHADNTNYPAAISNFHEKMPWIMFKQIQVELSSRDAGMRLFGYGLPNKIHF